MKSQHAFVPQTRLQVEAYSIPEFLRATGISPAFLYRLWNEGRGPRRIANGSKILIPKEDAEKWLKHLRMF